MKDRLEGASMLRVLNIAETCALYESIPKVSLLEGTRFVAHELDPPYWAPPYSSVLDDAIADGMMHKIKNNAYYAAMHPVKLQAGKAPMPNGELGRPAAADPVNTPELLGGRILHTNV